jgi:tetratricopeptide (TPR) repeat protein
MGSGSTLSAYVVESSLLPAEKQIYPLLATADEAVRISPSDPDAHYARAIALIREGQVDEAVREFERAVTLRPRDYKLWLTLGTIREELGDETGAIIAYNKAIRRAPYYAQPRWQLGNLLLRTGRGDEAFMELRRAAESDPVLLPGLIDLAWGVTGGDPRAVEEFIQPQTTPWRLALARAFARRGKAAESVALFRAAGGVSVDERRAFINDLLTAKRFAEAYEVWFSGRDANNSASNSGIAAITDGGFEGRINFDNPGFGWQLSRNLQTVRFSLDHIEPHAGSNSLRLDYNGDSNVTTPIVSQLVLVEPNARYRLRFAARAQEMVTGGPPVIVVTDASSNDARQLVQSAPLPSGTNNWQEYTIEFNTGEATHAVRINLQRDSCEGTPCPIFGRVWLDDFTLQKS